MAIGSTDYAEAFGWSGELKGQGSFEFYQASTWSVARIWTQPVRLRNCPRASSCPAMSDNEFPCFRVLIGVDGRGHIDFTNRSVVVGARELFILGLDEDLEMHCAEPWARFEWLIRLPRVVVRALREALASPREIDQTQWEIVAALSNILSTVSRKSGSAAEGFYSGVLVNLILATIFQSPAQGTADCLSPQRDAYRHAISVINERFLDPKFNVSILAEQLSMSRTHLHREFKRHGETPRRALEQRRSAAALASIGGQPDLKPNTLEAIARASGFVNRAQMMRAIERSFDPESQSDEE